MLRGRARPLLYSEPNLRIPPWNIFYERRRRTYIVIAPFHLKFTSLLLKFQSIFIVLGSYGELWIRYCSIIPLVFVFQNFFKFFYRIPWYKHERIGFSRDYRFRRRKKKKKHPPSLLQYVWKHKKRVIPTSWVINSVPCEYFIIA